MLNGLRERYEEFHGVAYTDKSLRAAAELSSRYLNDRRLPDKAIDLIDEAGAAAKLKKGKIKGAKRRVRSQRHRGGAGDHGPHPAAQGGGRRSRAAGQSRRRAQGQDLRPGPGGRAGGAGHQDEPRRARPAATGRSALRVRGPDRRRQDRAGQAAGRDAGRAVPALRHVGVHGAAHGVAPHRRASRLCRVRPGRPADRRHPPEPARGAAARRDREGAPGPVQPAVAGDGPRGADRQQRPQVRLPARHPDHDQQRRARGSCRGGCRGSATGGDERFGDTDEAFKRMFSPEFRNRLDAKVDFAPLDPGGHGADRRQVHRRAVGASWPRRR